MSAIAADGAYAHLDAALTPPRMPTGCSARAASGHAQVDAHPRHRGHRHFLRRFHGAGDRVCDASLLPEWKLTPTEVGMILSAGYVGQLFGAVIFGSLAEKYGRLKFLFITIVLFVSMDVACLFAWSGASMIMFRFLQGIGTGGEVPVASAYINEFIGAEKRGRFFLLYEVMFLIGLMFAGMAGYFLVPIYGWKAMFVVGLIPAVLTIPLRWFMPESPRWLASKGASRKRTPS